MIVTHDVNMMYVIGPGHGGPAAIAGTWLDGSYTDIYPSIGQDTAGMARLFRQFSFPGGVPSHVAPETPARSTRAANSATRSRTRTAPRSTTRTSSWPA